MTMEMWQLGFAMDRMRLVGLLIVSFPMLIALSHFAGFEPTFCLTDDILDVLAAFAVAIISAGVVFTLLGVLAPGQSLDAIIGKLAVISFPGAIGALLADKQLDTDEKQPREHAGTYLARLFIMTIGALFVALNVAPTEEIMLIAFQIAPWQTITLAIISLAMLHALLFWIDFSGREKRRGEQGFWSILLRYSIVGYALCCLTSFALLWVFGRTNGVGLTEMTEFVVVLAFPAALGAGLAGLVVGDNRDA